MATKKRTSPAGSAKKPSPLKGSPKASKKSAPAPAVIEASGEALDGDEDDLDDDEDSDEESEEEIDEREAAEVVDTSPFADEAALDEDFGDEADDNYSRPRRNTEGAPGSALAVRQESVARRDPLQIYMREVQQHSLLTPDEEKALAIRYAETADVNAAARLVTANLRLVVKLAYEYRRAYRNMMDLIQEGNMGLMQAVKKYDPYRGVKLSSYAAWWIRAYMLRYILANWRMVKLGTTQAQRKLFFNLNKEKARLSAMGIEPTNLEIARRLDVTEKEVADMDTRLARSDASLDTPVNESEGREVARVELLPAGGNAPDLETENAQLGSLLREHLGEFRKGLSGKDLIIFDERLIADDPRTLQDLGDQFGVSRERVRQLEARMTGKLRDYLSERIGDPIAP